MDRRKVYFGNNTTEASHLRTIWTCMRSRCNNKTHKSYKHYGERGITVCDRWNDPKVGIINFYSDMGIPLKYIGVNGKELTYTVDRIDNNGNYCKENCRWSTQSEQNLNSSRALTYNGKDIAVINMLNEGKTYSFIAKELHVSKPSIVRIRKQHH